MEGDSYFDKDNRSKRFVTTSFKKRENKREQDARNSKIDKRVQQSLRDKYGEDYLKMLENGEINGVIEENNGEKNERSKFDWSEDEKQNGPKQKKNNSKKPKGDKQKEYVEDEVNCAPKLKGRKNY